LTTRVSVSGIRKLTLGCTTPLGVSASVAMANSSLESYI
jgi:hypothetical protein